MTRSRSWDLSEKFIGACGAMVVAHLLEFSRALISANLDYNNIGDEGAIAISAVLESNTTLEHLSLKPCSDGTKITAVGAQAIAKMLVVNRALKTLNLSNNDIGGEFGYVKKDKLQGTSFKKGDTVQYNGQQCIVFMEEDSDGNLMVQNLSGVLALAEALKFNRALTSVNLLYNELGDGAAAVVAAAKQQGNIKTLCGIEQGKADVSFWNQGLAAPGAVLLSFDLEFNRALKSAYLGGDLIRSCACANPAFSVQSSIL